MTYPFNILNFLFLLYYGCTIKQEWDLALINVLTVATCNAIVVWSFDLQNTLQKLPNNIFEKSYPLREFDLQKRVHSFFYKAAELCMVGLSAGAVQGALSNVLASKKEGRLSVTIPSVSSNALGYGAFLGLYANLRYQLICGFDRSMANHFDVIAVALFFSTALRILNVQLGERSSVAWLGVEADPLVDSDSLLKVYSRPPEGVDEASSKWFISKKAVISGLGLLGIKQGTVDSVSDGQLSSPPEAWRKRIVREKVTTG
ncbi:protein RETICULATA-RELATED 1, chloroplastic-like [Corylus avellana]|uniref:protein RETICULATA-RELATED 1, chloroplastic-like n=1 Tax=Corylus avellana TaxID=13451 RepID=UPI00286B64D4|nr:protein RETICULATA-RELATED 1, chloroplastic-like [Corylus avellana]